MLVLIDDDELFRSALAANLRDDGFEVTEYENGQVVPLERLSNIDVVVTDYLMGKENGLTFATRFHTAFPTVPVIIITAFATEHLEAEVARHDYLSLLQKPLDYERLLELLKNKMGAR